ncbi:MAG: hypothetical protein DKINENOH_01271 [bacterium]|nr:hypothetical protein [bacterium]
MNLYQKMQRPLNHFVSSRPAASCVSVVLAVGMMLAACAPSVPEEYHQAQRLYRQNKLTEALPLFEQALSKMPSDVEAHAWLAETYRRLGRREEAVSLARRALALAPCNSFAHTVIADAYNPMYGIWESANSDSTWTHLQRAVACDSTDGNAWVNMWTEAMRRGETAIAGRTLATAAKAGFFAPAALAYCRWMLQNLPEQALLVTNGDMDTYPAVALQQTEAFRADVAVVNRSLLNTPWYARYLREHYGLSLPFPDAQLDSLRAFKDEGGKLVTVSDQFLRAWVAQIATGEFTRPVAFSVTVDSTAIATFKDRLQFAGPYLVWQAGSLPAAPDTAKLRVNLTGLKADEFAGPFVSAQDRSPVRRVYTSGLARNLTAAALAHSDLLINAGSFTEAQSWLSWAEEFEKKTEAGPTFTARISSLRDAAQQGLERRPDKE